MNVAQILADKGRDVVTAEADTTLMAVADILAKRKIGAAVILEGDKICGIASERDIVRQLATNGAGALDQPISSCMTRKVVDCQEEDSVDSVMEKMTKGRFRHMPVTDSGKLVGLVSIGDIVKRKIEQAERDAEDMKRYIAG